MQVSRCGTLSNQTVAKYLVLIRGRSRHLNGHHPVESDSRKTVGVLGTKIVRRKTYGNLGHGMAGVKPDEQIVVDTDLGEFDVYLWKAETIDFS